MIKWNRFQRKGKALEVSPWGDLEKEACRYSIWMGKEELPELATEKTRWSRSPCALRLMGRSIGRPHLIEHDIAWESGPIWTAFLGRLLGGELPWRLSP